MQAIWAWGSQRILLITIWAMTAFSCNGSKKSLLMVFWMLYEEITYEMSSVGWVNCIPSFANLSRRTPCLLQLEVHVFVCCECVWASSFSLHPFSFKASECCYDNRSWSLLHRSGPQCRHSGNLLTLGRQHKIGIIAVDYGTQWATASKRFIHPGKKDCAERKKKRGALVPPPLSHGGHRHDIRGLKERAFWTYPLPPSPTLLPQPILTPPPPHFFFFSRLCQFGCSAWPGKLGPLPLFTCKTKPLWRKREEAESFTWYQPRAGMAAPAYPFKGPSSAWKVLVWPP